MGRLPDFLICGFQKCGTSALSINLNQNPNIFIAKTDHPMCKTSHGKELNFFTSSKLKSSTNILGVDWYKSHFICNVDQKCGEISPSYSNYPGEVINNIKNYSKTFKFVFAIRNPIYRAYSAFNHFNQQISESRNWGTWSPGDNLIYNHENFYTFKCNYIRVIKEYCDAFGRENISILIQENLVDDKKYQNEYNKFFDFIDVEHCTIKNEKHHARKYKKMISNEEVEYLKDYYTDDVNKLFDFLGYKIQEWEEFC